MKCLIFMFLISLPTLRLHSQTTPPTKKDPSSATSVPSGNESTDSASKEIANLQKEVEDIKKTLNAEDPTFVLSLGIGSLVLNKGVTDYSDSSNVLKSNNLGRATPQYLVGVSMRSEIPNFGRHEKKAQNQMDCKQNPSPPDPNPIAKCQLWRRNPWSGFVSLKFAPSASQTLNGYVIGGSYSITKHLNILIGYALSPINEPAPGFRVVASQFVTQQQAQGKYLNFNPVAMLKNQQNAFDGFPVTDSTGKLIYSGNPLTVHYRGGAVFGVSIPVAFSSFLKSSQ